MNYYKVFHVLSGYLQRVQGEGSWWYVKPTEKPTVPFIHRLSYLVPLESIRIITPSLEPKQPK